MKSKIFLDFTWNRSMNNKISLVSFAQVAAISKSLGEASAALAKIASEMEQRKKDELLLCWSQRTYTALDVVTTAVNLSAARAKAEFDAIDQERPSHGEQTIQRRVVRQTKAVKSGEVKAGPGRPRKKTTAP